MSEAKSNNAFPILSLSTALFTLGLIVFGAVVRVTDSGLGCGNDWPLCNGAIFPPLDNITAWIEWLHRLFALLIGLFGLATLTLAWRHYRRHDRPVFKLVGLAATLFVIQSALGAIVVFLDLPPTFVTLHLGVAMLLLAALLSAAVMAIYSPPKPYSADSVSTLSNINAVFALLIILTGALVRGSGATLACTEWPLCNDGALIPLEQGLLAVIHMIHRLSVAAMALCLLLLIRHVMQKRSEPVIRQLAWAAGCAYLLQIGTGAMFVISTAGPAWGALHVGLAATVWAVLVVMVSVERINQLSYKSSGIRST